VAESTPPRVDRRALLALVTAAACAFGLTIVGVAALAVEAGHARDASVLRGFTGLYASSVESEIAIVARLVDPLPYTVMGLLCIAVAVARRRTSTAVATAVVLVGSVASAQALKALLGQPRYAVWLPGDSMQNWWPSGHATAAMTLALSAVIVAPPTWRAVTGLVACGGTVTVAYSTLALVWHYPSDVVAGFLLAGLWVSVALAVLASAEVAAPRLAPPPLLGLLVTLGAGGALIAAAVVGAASERVAIDTVERARVVVAALAIAAVALALLVVTAIGASEPGE